MRKICLFLLALFLCFNAQAQLVQIEDETFEGTLSGWTIRPSNSWTMDTNLYAGGHKSYKGKVPIGNNPGDTAILTSPIYDFSGLSYVWLSFSHICKISASDICQIEYREDNISSTWQPIPTSSYKGSGAYTNSRFSHNSYSDWCSYDSLATPNNGWWKTEQFNISDEVSYSRVQFRFKITRGTTIGSYFVYGWLIDNFKIYASVNSISPPIVNLITKHNDTVYNTGPFIIQTKTDKQTSISTLSPKLFYSTTISGVTINDSISMNTDDSIWTAIIPQQLFGSFVSYSVVVVNPEGFSTNVNDGFYVSRAPVGGYNVIVGEETLTDYYTPASMNSNYSWSRMLYLSSEINSNLVGGLITNLAWSYASFSSTVYKNQKCYLKAVDDFSLDLGYKDPILDGATLVWDDSLIITQGWVEITLQTPFYLPPGKNLHVYWHHENGKSLGSSNYWHHTNTSPIYRTVQDQLVTGFPSTSSGALRYERPNARFTLGYSSYDSNSVALYTIDNPKNGVISGIQPVRVTIKNKGIAYLDSCTINWTLNGVLQSPTIWSGHSPEDFNDTITIGYYSQRNSTFDTIMAWVSMPNGVVDSVSYDDTVKIISYGCSSTLNGEFIVGHNPGANFSSIENAFFVAGLCGVDGDVILKLQNGIYAENWDCSNLSDLIGNFTLSITSLSGNRDSVILKPTSGVGIILNNTNNLVLKNITIDNSISNAYGIQFTGGANNVEIRNIYFNGNTYGTTASNSRAPIYKATNTGVVDNIRFINNIINGGYYGLYFYGGTSNTTRGVNCIVDSNVFINQAYYATYFYFTNYNSVSYNTFKDRMTNTTTNWYGLWFRSCNGTIINANTIISNNTSSLDRYGIYCYSMVSTIISNNSIHLSNNIRNAFGLYTYYTEDLFVINNTVLVEGSSGTTYYGFWFNALSTSYNATIQNNIFITTGATNCYPIYTSSVTAITNYNIDYNCYYGPAYVGYAVSAKATLADLELSVPSDQHSVNLNPSFINVNNNLKLNNYTGLECNRYPNVKYDIEGIFRNIRTTMGCYTFALVGSNGALVEILHFDIPKNIGDTSALEIVLLNAGIDTIQSATINWSINNVLQPTVNWNGNLASQIFDTLNLGNIIYQPGYNYVHVWLSTLGNLTDSIPLDDSLNEYTYACYDSLSGDFILGQYPGADVSDIDEAMYIASSCGVKGDVTLKLQNDTYIENWNLTDLSNLMGSHTLTITSLSGNRDSVILKPAKGVGLILNNTNNFVIKDITIDNTSNNNYGIQFMGEVVNVEIKNIHFIGDTSGTTSNTSYAPIYKSSGTGAVDDVRFIGNTIEGGYYGIHFYGGTSTSVYGTNVVFDNNTVLNQYYSATYFYYTDFTSVSHNTLLSRNENAGPDWYGLYFYYCNFITNANKIHSKTSFTTFYGTYLFVSGNTSNTSLFSNNEIIGITSGTSYGIYGTGANIVNIINNSIHMSGSGVSSNLYVFNHTNANYNIQNNILIHAESGYPIYFSGTTTPFTSNNNCLYGNTYIGYFSSPVSTLTAWQTATGQDTNSVSLYPSFVDTTVGLELLDYSFVSCAKNPDVNLDINDSSRLQTTAMGCYTLKMAESDGALKEVINWKTSPVYAGDTSNLKVILLNSGESTITSATIDWKFNNIAQASIHWSGNLALEGTDTIDLGTVMYMGGNNELIVWISNLGSLNDNKQLNDTVREYNYTCDSMLNGYYTIGTSGHFADMDEALALLNLCGINGPVTFAIQPGTYYQNTTIGYINGSSPTNTITFTSTTGDSTDVILQRADDATSSLAPLMISNGENIIIEKLTLSGVSPISDTSDNYSFSHGIIINGMSRNIEVKNCFIYVPSNFSTAITGTNHNPVCIKDASVYDIRIFNNSIQGGACGVYVSGTNNANYLNKIIVKNNIIEHVDTYGILLNYGDSIFVEGNIIRQRIGYLSQGNLYGIYAYYVNADLLSNQIWAVSFNRGLYTNYLNHTAIRPALIANNVIMGNINSTSYYGYYVYNYTNANIYHNSFYFTGANQSRGVYIQSHNSINVSFKNNSILMDFDNTTNPYPIYLGSTSYIGTKWFVDYNNYYNVNGTNVGYASGAKTTLAAWKTVVSTDMNSVSVLPKFLNKSTNLMIVDTNGITCPLVTEVLYDIQDSLRSSITTMGAYHFEPSHLDALPFAFTSPTTTLTTGISTPINVILSNNGLDTLKSVMIACQINEITNPPTSWTGILPPGDTTSIHLGNFIPISYTNKIKVYTYLPNGQADQFTINDTLSLEIFGCDSMLSGTYTIGSSGDFTSINSAIKVIEHCGISSSVIFEIQNGTYTDALTIGVVQGVNDSTNITFVSQTRNASNVLLNAEHTALRVMNASHIKFECLTIYGEVIGVELVGTCENIEFYKCTLAANKTSDKTYYRAVNYANSSASGNLLKNVRFTGNTISGGYYNMFLSYVGSSNTEMINSLVTIDSNLLVDAYYYGIYANYYGRFKSISNNRIITRTEFSNQYGIYTNYITLDEGMIGNRVFVNSTSTNYGIYLNYINTNTFDDLALIANNEIICYGENNTMYGIYCSNISTMIFNNSISLYGTGNNYGLYINSMSSSYQMIVKNNIFATSGNGNGYPIYTSTANYATQTYGTYLDYNNYYSLDSNVGCIGSTVSTLAALRVVTGQDQNSISVNPAFVGINNLSLTSYTGFDCPRLSEVQTDIQNYKRGTITTMGAYVRVPSNTDASIDEIIGFSTASASGSPFPISVIIRNAGFTPLSSATINGQVNGVNISPVSYTPSVPLLYGEIDTVNLGSYTFTSGANNIMTVVSMNNDTIQDNDTLRISRFMCIDIMGGEYIIGTSLSADYPSIDSVFSDILRCGIINDINLKFETGVYNGSWDLSNLGYYMKNYSLTITSLAGDKDSVVFSNSAGVLFNLNNTHNVLMKSITLDAKAGTFAVDFSGNASNITIDNCNILASPTVSTTDYGAINKKSSTGLLNNFTLKNCYIDGGYYGVYLYGTSSQYVQNVTIDSNNINNQYYYGIYLYYVNSNSTSYNIVTPRSINQGNVWYGINLYWNKNGGNVIGNRIFADNPAITGTIYGMQTMYIDSALVGNNDIYLNSNAGTTYGMYVYFFKACRYIHNSILITGISNKPYAMYMRVTASDEYDINMKNNIFVVNGGTTPYAMYFNGTYDINYSQNYRIDYNNYYSSGSMGYVGGIQSTLMNWKSIVITDQNSTYSLPSYVSVNHNLKLSDYSAFTTNLIPDFKFDRENVERHQITAKGAYDMNLLEIDASLTDFDTTNLIYNQLSPIVVNLNNSGIDTLTSATIHWTFNGVAQTPYSWTGNVAIYKSETINLGNILTVAGINHIVAWISNPNNATDSNSFNDTIHFSVYICAGTFSGLYTVGNTSSDFINMENAFNALNECGISGNVTLSIVSGSYNGLSITGAIKGTDDTTTVTITSSASYADSVIFEGSPALSLLNTAYLSFKNVTFNTKSGGHAVLFNGITNNIEISHCNIYADPTGTVTSSSGIYKGASSIASNIRINANNIDGGYYGVYLYGTSSQYVQNVTIDSNILNNQFYYGILNYYVNTTSISYNTVEARSINQGVNWYGFHLNYNNNKGNIIGNRIFANNIGITSSLYGMRYYYVDSVLVANNEIYLNSAAHTTHGIYIEFPKACSFLHNSILLTGSSSYPSALYWSVYSNDDFNATLMNNLLITNNDGGTPYAIYLSGDYSSAYAHHYRIDYNNYYSSRTMGYSSTSFGYVGGTPYTALANWKSVVVTDSHSISILPIFANINTNLELTDYSLFFVPKINEVQFDINGNYRTSITMMGANTILLSEGYNLELSEIISPKEINDIYCVEDYVDVKVVVSNVGIQDYDFTINNLNLNIDVNGAINFQFDTIINVGSLNTLKKDTIVLTDLLPVSMMGLYHITVSLSSVVDTVYSNDTLKSNYSVYKIQLPYDVDFSYIPAEFIFKQVLGSVNWEIQSGSGSNPTIAPTFGSGRLHFASESGAGSIAQAIINGIDLRGSNQPSLEFWFAHDNTSYNTDFVAIKVSTDGGVTTQTLHTVYRYHAWYVTPGWEHIVVDLSAYTQESCLSLIFEASSFGGENQNIDRIYISSKPDVAASLIAPKEEDLVACKTSNQKLKVVVSNLNTQMIDFDTDTSNIHIEITGAAVANYTYPLSGQLAGLSSDTLEITQTFNMSNNGNYRLIAYIEAVDSNFVNDTSKVTIQINNDLSIDKIVGVDAVNCKKIGDSVYISFTIFNLGTLIVNEVPLRLQINGASDIVDTIYTVIMPGDSLIYAFTKPYIVPTVTYSQPYYFVKVQTLLSCDAQNTNNTREIIACVDLPEIVDLHIQTVHKPLETVCDTGLHTVYVSVTLANKGTSDISSAVLHVEIDSAGTPWASFSETTDVILSKDTSMHIFTQGYIVPNFNGNYSVKVFVDSLMDDKNLTNDTLEILACAILNDVSIDAYKTVNWTMGQNIPNPASAITRIPYSIPQEGVIHFTLTTITGQILYSRDIPSAAGSHSMEFDTQHLAGGIYYYSMEYQGQRIVKKMTIQK